MKACESGKRPSLPPWGLCPQIPLENSPAGWFHVNCSVTFSGFPVEMGLLQNSITAGIDFGKLYFLINYPFRQGLPVYCHRHSKASSGGFEGSSRSPPFPVTASRSLPHPSPPRSNGLAISILGDANAGKITCFVIVPYWKVCQ